MLELAIKGSKKYYGWIAFLLVIVGIGFARLGRFFGLLGFCRLERCAAKRDNEATS